MCNLSVRKMRIFLAAVEEGSFTRASVRENISQPAATIVINEIEETVGVPLFCRRGNMRQAKVTDAGRSITEIFGRVVSVYDSETSTMKDIVGGGLSTSRVLLQRGFSDFLRGSWLMSLNTALAPRQVSLETLERGQIVDAIRGRDAVLGLIDGISEDDRSEQIKLGSYKMVLASPCRVDGTVPAPLKSWEDLPSDCMVFGDLNPRLSRRLKKEIESSDVDFGSLMLVSNVVTIAEIMQVTGRAAIVPDVLVPTLNRICANHVVDLPGAPLVDSFGIVAPLGILARAGLSKVFQPEKFDVLQSA